MSSNTDFVNLVVASAAPAARDIQRFELVHPDGASLPPFTAGSHIRIKTPIGVSSPVFVKQRSRRAPSLCHCRQA